MSDDDATWLRDRLHAKNCRQCDLVRALLDERDEVAARFNAALTEVQADYRQALDRLGDS